LFKLRRSGNCWPSYLRKIHMQLLVFFIEQALFVAKRRQLEELAQRVAFVAVNSSSIETKLCLDVVVEVVHEAYQLVDVVDEAWI